MENTPLVGESEFLLQLFTVVPTDVLFDMTLSPEARHTYVYVVAMMQHDDEPVLTDGHLSWAMGVPEGRVGAAIAELQGAGFLNSERGLVGADDEE